MEEVLICGVRRLGILCLKDAHATWPQSIHWACFEWGYVISEGFSRDSAGKESACNSEDLGSIHGLGRSPGEGKCYPLQYSGLENSVDSILSMGLQKSQTWLSDFHVHTSIKSKWFSSVVVHFSSVQSLSHARLFETPWTAADQAPLSITNYKSSPKPIALSRWCHPTISSSVVPFSSCPQSFPASESFQMSYLLPSAGQSIGVSASTSVLPMNTQDWSPLGWTGWIFLQSKGLSRVFSNTTVQKHQFFSVQLSL